MLLPSKVTNYQESSLAKFPLVLEIIQECPKTPIELFQKVKKKITGISEFIEIMDCLYALHKIELKGGLIFYVD